MESTSSLLMTSILMAENINMKINLRVGYNIAKLYFYSYYLILYYKISLNFLKI